MSLQTNRRDFLKGAAAAGVGFWVAGRVSAADEVANAKSPNEKLNIASIGIGGKGESDSDQAAKHGNLVAICDTDTQRLEKFGQKHSKAQKFTDFRQMFDKLGKEIDAVTISTPDHTHAVATMLAIKAGKHVYTQKPLTHDVWESRQLQMAAKEHKVASQMGNQGTASPKLREGVDLIQAGVLGAIKEAHIWTNRPVWPQSPEIKARPKEEEVPEHVKWDLWLGTAPERPYNGKYYHPFNWRGWWDYGTGALGDMGCHTANLPFMALKLGAPKTIQGWSEELNPETYPAWGKVAYEFGEREGMAPCTVTWYEGRKDKKLVHPPEELVAKVLEQGQAAGYVKPNKQGKIELNNSGFILVGEKGIMYSAHDYGGSWVLLPGDEFKDKKVEPKLPRNKEGGDEGMKIEWLAAAKGGPPAMSNFDYAGPLTEFILLGNIAILGQGKKLEWDGPGMTFTNASEMNKHLKREYRQPWKL